jgi:hypothetical protein
MNTIKLGIGMGHAMVGVLAALASGCGGNDDDAPRDLVAEGKQVFRYDTFGDEAKWTDTLRMHEVISAAVDPTTALSVGLKVDADALPQSVKDGIAAGTVDLKSPTTTLALLKLDAVVGLKGKVSTQNGADTLERVGVTCALCHSTVDNSFAPGIGKRLDGWPNRDLNVGAIIALSPAVSSSEKAVLNGWGAGRYDPRHNIDGLNKPVVIPPAYGLAGIGKIKTIVQMVALVMLLYREPLFGLPIFRIGEGLLAVAAVLTLWSALAYLRPAWPAMLADSSRPCH